MPIITKYKAFPFTTTVEAFTASAGVDTTATRNATDAALQMSIIGRNKTNAANRWYQDVNLANLFGYTTGSNLTSSVVTGVTASYVWRCTTYTNGEVAENNDGPFKFQTTAGTDIVSLIGTTNFTTTTAWATKTGTGVLNRDVTGSIRLYLGNDLGTINNATTNVVIQQDTLQITASINESYLEPPVYYSSSLSDTFTLSDQFIGSYAIVERMLLGQTSSWYWTTQNLDAVAWTASAYDTTGWYGPHPGAIYQETVLDANWTYSTAISGSRTYAGADNSYQFVADVDLSDITDPTQGTYTANFLIDDGCLVFVNGVPAYSLGLSVGSTYATFTTRTAGDAVNEGPFTISSSAFVQGINRIAVQVNQSTAASTDLVMGMRLDMTIPSQYVSVSTGSVAAPTQTMRFMLWTDDDC